MKKIIEKAKKRSQSLKTEILAVYLAYKKHKLPWYANVVAVAVIAYALSPVDIIPDFIPVLGMLDDFIIIPLGIALLIKLIPPNVMRECREEAAGRAYQKLPQNYFVAAVIVLMWIFIFVFISIKIAKAFS